MTREQFLTFSDPLPEPTLLLAADGVILAGNRAVAERLGVGGDDIRDRRLADLVADAADEVAHFLRLCARSRRLVLGALTVRGIGADAGVPCRAEGALLRAAQGGTSALLLLRLTPKASAIGQFVTLNQRIDELGREVQRRRRAEAEARAQEERLRVTLHSIGDAVIATDAAGAVVLMNAVAEALTGWTQSAAAGEPLPAVFQIINEATRQPVENPALRALREGVIVGLANHTVLIARDGTTRPIDDSAAPIRDAAGGVIGSVLVFRDITDRRQTMTALRESESRFRQLADAMPQIVWSAGPDGRIDYLNRRWSEFTGQPQSASNDAWRGLLHPDEAGAARDRWADSLRTGRPFEMPLRLLDRRDGTYRWHLFRTVPVTNDAGAVIRWFGTATDIQEQKRAEEAARYLADASAALAAVVDYESTLQKVANLAVPYFADWAAVDVVEQGRPRRLAVAHQDADKVDLVGRIATEYPPDPEAPHGPMAVLRTGAPELLSEIPDALLEQSARDSRHLDLIRSLGLTSFICVPLATTGPPFGVLTFATAESGRRYTDADLALAMDLAHRAAVAVENTRLYQALRETDRRKDEFLATLAHELRNPLAPIRNALQILNVPRVDASTAGRAREMLERQVHHLVRLVDDLMDVSRVMRGRIDLRRTRVELAAVVARAVETAQPLIDAHGHRLTMHLPEGSLALDADPVRLAQIIGNLLANAVKYTEPPGRIWISAAREGDRAVLRVRDNGIGIPPEMVSQIFELFTQADHAAGRSQGGLGIGLTLVKNLAEMHGGSVAASSAGPGQGSEFIVRLPLAPAGADAGADHAGAPVELPPPSGCRVLVVDDNRDAANSLATVLRLRGHDVRVAYTGHDALRISTTYTPDVAFLDIGMPGLDGYELARLLRRQPGWQAVTLAALTGWGQREDRRRSAEAGFDRHLVKPPEPEAIEQILTDRGPRRDT